LVSQAEFGKSVVLWFELEKGDIHEGVDYFERDRNGPGCWQFHVGTCARSAGEGSGFLVDPRGYILTAEHVVDEAGSKKIEVIIGGQHRYLAEVVKADKSND